MQIKNVTIYIVGANGESFEYFKNNEYKNQQKEDVINIFKLTKFEYMATELDGYNFSDLNSFNTCNWNAPYTLCGVAPSDIYSGSALVNIHLGGDVRGNYSNMYICEEVDALFLQTTFLDIEISNGEIYTFNCDNSEAFFDFETIDPYYIDFDSELTTEQIKELKELSNN